MTWDDDVAGTGRTPRPWRTSRTLVSVVGFLWLAGPLAACAGHGVGSTATSVSAAASTVSSGAPASPTTPSATLFAQRAAVVAAAYGTTSESLYVLRSPALDLVRGPTKAQQAALVARRFTTSLTLSTQEAMGGLDIPGRPSRRVTVISARAAFENLTGSPTPSGPTDAPGGARPATGAALAIPVLNVTGAVLASTPVRTQFGVVSVPVWRFTVAGLTGPVQVVALEAGELGTASAPPPTAAEAAVLRDVRLLAVGESSVTVAAVPSPCDAAVSASVWENPSVVVVGGLVTAGSAGSAGSTGSTGSAGMGTATPGPVAGGTTVAVDPPCPLLPPMSQAITLRDPLGSRLVVDAMSGRPLTVSAGS